MIFDVNGASGALMKIHREIVGSRPIEKGSSQLVGVHRVVFEFYADGKLHETVDCGTAELGLPETDTPPHDAALRRVPFPREVGDALRRLMTDFPPDEILWLWLSEPYGYVPALPFEEMLAGAIPGHPVVRLSCDNVTSAMFKQAHEAVLCFSSPGSNAEKAVKNYLAILPPPDQFEGYKVNVFADARARKLFLEEIKAYGDIFTVHDPPASIEDLCKEEASAMNAQYDARHPWLAWILDTLEHRAIDYVHFVCHGVLSSYQGGLIFAEPVVLDDSRTTRPLYATEVDRFLDRLGAWSFSITSPIGNPSIGGTRYFVEQIAQMRYGPVLLQELATDPDGSQLLNSVRYYVDRAALQPAPSVARYWNPNRNLVHPASRVDDVTLHPIIEHAFKSEPETAATVQRAFDTLLARYQRASDDSEAEHAIRSGIGDALKFVYKLVAEKGQTESPDDKGGR